MPADAQRRIFTATLIIGVPGSGKTALLGTFARYLWETYKKVLLLYSWDGGAIPTEVQKLMKQGLIRFWRARTRSAPGLGIETTMLATKGYWPTLIDPETGETSPAVDLVSPLSTAYHVRCKQGHALAVYPRYQDLSSLFCNECRTYYSVNELLVDEQVTRTRGFEQVGGVAYDGLTSIGYVTLDHMDEARGAGQIGGEKSAFGGVVVSGSIKFGGGNRADIGFGQTRCRQAVHNSLSIPYLVEGPVFTALSMEATDEGGLPVVGAKLPGRAATDEASSWVGNCFELGKTPDEQGHELFTLFLRPFTDAQNRRHLLKTSASPAGLPDKLVDPFGQPWKQANLGLVFEMLDKDLNDALKEEIAGAPGLAGTPSHYGEPFRQLAQPTPPPEHAPVVAAAPPVAQAPTPEPHNHNAPAPVTVTARRRRAEPAVDPAPAPEPVAVAVAAVAGAPPPPPGMKPPQRAPGT